MPVEGRSPGSSVALLISAVWMASSGSAAAKPPRVRPRLACVVVGFKACGVRGDRVLKVAPQAVGRVEGLHSLDRGSGTVV